VKCREPFERHIPELDAVGVIDVKFQVVVHPVSKYVREREKAIYDSEERQRLDAYSAEKAVRDFGV
jgi:hypothetical protein